MMLRYEFLSTLQDVRAKVSFEKIHLITFSLTKIIFTPESFAILDVISDLGEEQQQNLKFLLRLLLKTESPKRLFGTS